MRKFALSLSGFGYWTDMQRVPEGMVIKIQVLSESPDDIELECLVDTKDLIDKLENINRNCPVRELVILNFIVHYTQFSYCHDGLTEQDPKQMVLLKGKLAAFHSWLRDSELPPATSPNEI